MAQTRLSMEALKIGYHKMCKELKQPFKTIGINLTINTKTLM